VTDAGEVVGQTVTDATLREVAAVLRELEPEARVRIERVPIRQSTQQFLTTLQYQLILVLEYRLYNMKEKKDAIGKTKATGTTTFFVGGDQTESQRQAFPLAAVSAAQALVTSIANRGW
jgi:hypothetical protein